MKIISKGDNNTNPNYRSVSKYKFIKISNINPTCLQYLLFFFKLSVTCQLLGVKIILMPWKSWSRRCSLHELSILKTCWRFHFSSLTNCAVRIFIIFKFALHILRFQICLTLQIALLAHNAN